MFNLKFKNKTKFKNEKGFSLIEVLFVIGIISLLSSVILTNMNDARKMGRDGKRLIDMKEIQKALEFYYDENGEYPDSDGDGCGGWDVGNRNLSFMSGGLGQAMPNPPEDSVGADDCSGYRYYKYSAGFSGCDISKGDFYVLGVTDMESSNNPHPKSIGWSCPDRDWQEEMDWVVGGFEN